MKIFVDTGEMDQSAHFGWQNKDEALYGLREGYKNSADELVEIAVNSGGNPKILDTFIFPLLSWLSPACCQPLPCFQV